MCCGNGVVEHTIASVSIPRNSNPQYHYTYCKSHVFAGNRLQKYMRSALHVRTHEAGAHEAGIGQVLLVAGVGPLRNVLENAFGKGGVHLILTPLYAAAELGTCLHEKVDAACMLLTLERDDGRHVGHTRDTAYLEHRQVAPESVVQDHRERAVGHIGAIVKQKALQA